MNQKQLKVLYSALKKIRDLAPWDELHGDMVMAVIVSGNDEPYYCVFFHDMLENNGFIAYKGVKGLAVHQQLMDMVADEQLIDVNNQAYHIAFVWQEEMSLKDLELAKKANVRWAKEDLWPSIMKITPGYAPNFPKDEELIEIGIIATQLLRGYQVLQEDEVLFDAVSKGDILRLDDEIALITPGTHLIPREAPEPLTYPKLELDEMTIARCNKNIKVKDSAWEMDINNLNVSVQANEGEDDVYLRIFTITDKKDGIILHHENIPSNLDMNAVAMSVLTILQEKGIAKTIYYKSSYLGHIIQHTLKQPKVRFHPVTELHFTDEMMDEMRMDMLGEGHKEDYVDQMMDVLLSMPEAELNRLMKTMPKEMQEILRAEIEEIKVQEDKMFFELADRIGQEDDEDLPF